ncbi:MAG: DsbA family protein [Steroidobacteraceae bacterium]
MRHTHPTYALHFCVILLSVAGLCLLTTTAQAFEPARFGAASADVTIVEYFDYNCPYCKKLGPALRDLPTHDPGVAVVYKEWPILGDVSEYAARAALAAKWQRKYRIAHDALLDGPRLSNDAAVDAALVHAGVDIVKLKHDEASHATEVNSELARNKSEARELGIRGTPGIVINGRLVSGVIDMDGLKRSIAEARADR